MYAPLHMDGQARGSVQLLTPPLPPHFMIPKMWNEQKSLQSEQPGCMCPRRSVHMLRQQIDALIMLFLLFAHADGGMIRKETKLHVCIILMHGGLKDDLLTSIILVIVRM